jgi:hypothetical protein
MTKYISHHLENPYKFQLTSFRRQFNPLESIFTSLIVRLQEIKEANEECKIKIRHKANGVFHERKKKESRRKFFHYSNSHIKTALTSLRSSREEVKKCARRSIPKKPRARSVLRFFPYQKTQSSSSSGDPNIVYIRRCSYTYYYVLHQYISFRLFDGASFSFPNSEHNHNIPTPYRRWKEEKTSELRSDFPEKQKHSKPRPPKSAFLI